MWYFAVIIVSVVWISVFIWVNSGYKKQRKGRVNKRARPPFRSEEDLEGYEKPLKDYGPPVVDFDDAG